MRQIFRLIVCVMCMVYPVSLFADAIDSLQEQLRKHPQIQEKIYIHTDNQCYYVGDTLWYKAYVLRSDNLKPTNYSKLLYVELLTPDGYLVERQQLLIDEMGGAWGQFALQDSLYSGYYELRAYTKWNLNFNVRERPHSAASSKMFYDEQLAHDYYREFDGLYSRVLPVYEKPMKAGNYDDKRIIPRPKQRVYADKPELKVKFYPEGGMLVNGLKNRIAFEVTDNDGQALTLVGKIANGLMIGTRYGGRGVFDFTPDRSQRKVSFRWNDKEYDFDLPEAHDSGCVIRYDVDKMLLTAEARNVKMGAVAVSCRGGLCAFQKLVNGDKLLLDIKSLSLRTGINDIVIYDTDANPLASRLIFVNNGDVGKKLDMSVKKKDGTVVDNKTEVGAYDALMLSCHKSTANNVSVAVRDGSSDEMSYDNGNILTEMLLSGDLKGFVANPAYYFKDNDPDRQRQLDMLLMVQGWRKYSRVKQVRYLPERTFTFTGQVLNPTGRILTKNDATTISSVSIPAYLRKFDTSTTYGVVVSAVDSRIFSYVMQEGKYANGVIPGQILGPKSYDTDFAGDDSDTDSADSEEATDDEVEEIDIFDEASFENDYDESNYLSHRSNVKNLADIIVEAELMKDNDIATLKTSVNENGFFKIHLPCYYDNAILMLTAYQAKDSLKYSLSSVKNKDFQNEYVMPQYFVRREMFFPTYCKHYSWYQYNLPEDYGYEADDYSADFQLANNKLAGDHMLQNVTVTKFRKSKRALQYNKPAIKVDAYRLYNDLTDYGLSGGVFDMRAFSKQVAQYLFGGLDLNSTCKVEGRLEGTKQGGTTFYRNFAPAAYQDNGNWGEVFADLCLERIHNVSAFSDYDRRRGTRLESDGKAAVTVMLQPVADGAKRYTYRDRRYVFDGITYSEEFYSPDYSNMKPAEPTDYRRTLYWNPDVKLAEDGSFSVPFFGNSHSCQIKVSASGVGSDGTLYY